LLWISLVGKTSSFPIPLVFKGDLLLTTLFHTPNKYPNRYSSGFCQFKYLCLSFYHVSTFKLLPIKPTSFYKERFLTIKISQILLLLGIHKLPHSSKNYFLDLRRHMYSKSLLLEEVEAHYFQNQSIPLLPLIL
jgi:hypothetical protein